MSLEDPNIIDIVTTDTNDNPQFVICDSGLISESTERLKALMAKLKAYGSHLASDKFKSDYPSCKLTDVSILVMCASEPTDDMKKITSIKVGRTLGSSNRVNLRFEVQEFSQEEPPPFDISDLMQESVERAFTIARKWLEEEDVFLFIYWSENGKENIAPLKPDNDNLEPLDMARRWASTVGTRASIFVLVGRAQMIVEGVNTDVVMANCAERQQSHGFLLSQTLQRDVKDNRLKLSGNIECVSTFVNDIFVDEER